MHRFTLLAALAGTVAILSATTGCYRYSYVDRGTLQPGENIRVRLSPEEAARVGAVLGRDDRVYDGRVIDAPDTSLTLAVRSFVEQQGGATLSGHQRIMIARSSVIEMQRRTLDRPRTITTVAVAVMVTAAATIATFNAVRGRNENGTKLPGQQNRLPPPHGLLIPLRIAIPH